MPPLQTMIDTWNTAGYITSSRYRRAVCEYLYANGPSLPSEIAGETDMAQPHVSRALSELRDRDAVELLVPESQQKGRLYGLTDEGLSALDRLQRNRRTLKVTIVDRDEFPYPNLLEHLLDRHESAVRAVVAFENSSAWVYVASEEIERDYDRSGVEEVVSSLWSDRIDRNEGPAEFPTGGSEFSVEGFEHLTSVRLFLGAGHQLSVLLDPEYDVPIRSFVDECREQLPATV